jgi:hypothetical protein
MSDGTSTLHFLDPRTFEEIGQVEVFDNNGPVTRLNELEYVKGEIYANVWQTDWVAQIAPETGRVVGWVDLEGLLGAEDRSEPVDVLNGIAYDAQTDRLFVTGKLWPKLFEIELIPPDQLTIRSLELSHCLASISPTGFFGRFPFGIPVALPSASGNNRGARAGPGPCPG